MVKSVTESVTVTKLNSTLTIGLSRDDGPPGDVNIGGILFRAGTTWVVPYATVELYVNGLFQAYDTTDSTGKYLFTVDFDEGTYSIYTHFAGDATYMGDDSPTETATYAKIPAAFSGFSVSPNSGAAPLKVSIDGTLIVEATDAPLEQKTVHLYRDDVEIDSMLTSSLAGRRGEFWFEDTLDSMGDYEYYVEFEGDDEYAGCEEHVRSLPCEVCGAPVPLGAIGSDTVCSVCHSVFEVVG